MPPAETLIGRCRKGWNNVCTNRANFHVFLSNLGKTNITTNIEEMQLINPEMRKVVDPIRTDRNVFLYEVSQLSDRDNIRSNQFRQDLQQFLHLNEPIPPFIWFKPGKNHTEGTDNERKIDICDVRYDKLRAILLKIAIEASNWLRQYFMHSNGVIVSSKSYLESTILKSWEIDPCVERRS
jgi:hypothetical protein